MKRRAAAQILALLFLALPLHAQLPERIELSVAELQRLGVTWTQPTPLSGRTVLSTPVVAVVPPEQETVVSAPAAGLITRVLVAEGSEVAPDAPLLELRSLELLGAQREYIDAASAHRIAEAQLDRDRMLFDEGIVARRRLDEAEADALAARVRTEQARQQLMLYGADDEALRRLAASGDISADLTLRAPDAGVIVDRHGAVGERVEPLEPLIRIANLERLWLEARVPQERVHDIKTGMALEITTRGVRAVGEIIAIGRSVDASTQTVLVRALIDNPQHSIRAGQVVQARVIADDGGEGLSSVPMASIARLDGQAVVFARDAAGVRLVPVSIVGEADGRAQVAGLDSSGEIAARGVSALKALLTAEEE